MLKDNSNPSFADIIADILGDAISDVRQRVVEEPWFGKMLTGSSSIEPFDEAERSREAHLEL